MRIKVMILTNTSGACVSPAKGYDLNTKLGSGHPLVENLVVPYAIRNAPKVNASLMRKYHIIILPYSRLKGLLPPLHHFVPVVAVADISWFLKFAGKVIG